jgi:hypothetical protein
MRIFVFSYLIVAALIACITTVLQLPPARWVIDRVVDSSNRFSIAYPLAAVFLGLIIPLVVILLVRNLLGSKKQVLPELLVDHVVITFHRKRLLFGAMYPVEIRMDGTKYATVGNGRKCHVSVPFGEHEVYVQSFGKSSEPLVLSVAMGNVVEMEIGYDLRDGNQFLYCKQLH